MSAQAALHKGFDERLQQDTSPTDPSPHLKPQYLDGKYINNWTGSLPVFASARRVEDATTWLDAARTSRDTLEYSGPPVPEDDCLFAHRLATGPKDSPQQWYRTSFLASIRATSHRNARFPSDHLLDAFEEHYISCRKVQESLI
jgi:hypothetical protein